MLEVLDARHDAFHELGCRASDLTRRLGYSREGGQADNYTLIVTRQATEIMGRGGNVRQGRPSDNVIALDLGASRPQLEQAIETLARSLGLGTTVHCAGFVADGQLREIDRFTVETTTGDEDLPTAATMAVGPLELAVTPLHLAPVLLVAPDGRVGRFPRALCRFTPPDAPAGVGWTEWNQPPPPSHP